MVENSKTTTNNTPYIPGHESENGDLNMAEDLGVDNSKSPTFASLGALPSNSNLRAGPSLVGSAFPSLTTSKPSGWRPAKKLAQGDMQLSPLPELVAPSDLAYRRLNMDFFHLIVLQI